MSAPWPRLLGTLLIALVAAGPLAALAMAVVPPSWRGPAVPAVALAATVLAVHLWRRRARDRKGSARHVGA